MKDFAKSIRTNNTKVGNGSGSWRGKFYEDSAGNSASVEKRGEGWEVYWEDSRGYGKPLGTYKDERTAREVAEDAVESEMPDRIRANYKSKAINSKVGNENWGRARDAQGWYETYTDAVKDGDQNKIERYKNKLKDRLHDMELKRKEILEDLKDTEEAIKIYKKVGNRKVTNSAVREYKDSEGRIAQIDFNEDGTDADMSIYEDERMTRTVESKNFSTIRDAEQYVQSHGFRRVG